MPPPPPTVNNPLTRITGADPAAGAEVSEAIPTGKLWERLYALWVTLVTDTGVANRTVDVIFVDDAGNEISRVSFTTAIPASQTVKLHIGNWETVPTDTSTNHYRKIPPEIVKLGPAFTIKTVTALIESGDDYGTPFILVDELSVHN